MIDSLSGMNEGLLTELRRLQDAELNLRNALETARVGHWSWMEGKQMIWDGQMRQLFGVGREALSHHIDDFLLHLDPESQETLVKAFDQASMENRPFDLTLQIEKTGLRIRLTGGIYLLPGSLAKTFSGLCMKATEPPNNSPDANFELANFASVASHDLREPLRMVTSYLNLLQERYPECLDDRGRGYITAACEGADRMRVLIEALLRYARVDSEADPPGPVDLMGTIEASLRILAPQIEETNAHVEIAIDNQPIVLGDSISLVRLFQNLLSNALKFQPAGTQPKVSIRLSDGKLRDDPGAWIVSVIDNGIGIDPAHQELLFQLFQRLHTRDEFEGSGIGLAVCKKITDRLGGRIHIQSKPGCGSTFSVHLRKIN